jgi:5-methylcytosine-specific restriction endonuclease McrA
MRHLGAFGPSETDLCDRKVPFRPPLHRPPGWHPPSRSATDPYYHSLAHQAFRTAVLRRDGFRCTALDCSTTNQGAGGRLIADHIIARADGGPDVPENGRTLCPACDNRRHREKGLT